MRKVEDMMTRSLQSAYETLMKNAYPTAPPDRVSAAAAWLVDRAGSGERIRDDVAAKAAKRQLDEIVHGRGPAVRPNTLTNARAQG